MSLKTLRTGWVTSVGVLAVGSTLLVGTVRLAGAAGQAKPTANASSVKLTKPWSEISSLSDEQRTKIHDIHVKALAQVSEIEKQEKADIMAVLDDKQKVELKEAMSKDRKGAAERRSAKAGAPTTAPSK